MMSPTEATTAVSGETSESSRWRELASEVRATGLSERRVSSVTGMQRLLVPRARRCKIEDARAGWAARHAIHLVLGQRGRGAPFEREHHAGKKRVAASEPAENESGGNPGAHRRQNRRAR